MTWYRITFEEINGHHIENMVVVNLEHTEDFEYVKSIAEACLVEDL